MEGERKKEVLHGTVSFALGVFASLCYLPRRVPNNKITYCYYVRLAITFNSGVTRSTSIFH